MVIKGAMARQFSGGVEYVKARDFTIPESLASDDFGIAVTLDA